MNSLDVTRRYTKTLPALDRSLHLGPAWTLDVDNPFLHGLYAPVAEELCTTDLRVEGTIPEDLQGTYYRNGPNPKYKPQNRYHWFDGDGMIWAISLANGVASYQNRWINTRCLAEEERQHKAIWPGILGPFNFDLPISPIKETANTDLFFRQNCLYATWYETGEVYGLDPKSLATLGRESFLGQIPQMSAHSKCDPKTGEVIFFGCRRTAPYLFYGVLSPNGAVYQTDIELPGPRLPHDIGVTENYSILHDFPVIYDPERLYRTGQRLALFQRHLPSRFGVIPRFGGVVQWFECEPCYMLHVVHCYEDGDEVVQIGCRTKDPTLKINPKDGELAGLMAYLTLSANLYEWRLNLKTGLVKERDLSDHNWEFPAVNRSRLGQKQEYAYLQEIPREAPPTFDALIKYHVPTGRSSRYAYGPGVFGSEAAFAPRPGSTDEDDGYLITFTTDMKTLASHCLIFLAQDIEHGPVARIQLPHRLPAGFHAIWVDGQ